MTKNAQLVGNLQAMYNSRGSKCFFYQGQFVHKPSPSFVLLIEITSFGVIKWPVWSPPLAIEVFQSFPSREHTKGDKNLKNMQKYFHHVRIFTEFQIMLHRLFKVKFSCIELDGMLEDFLCVFRPHEK